MLPIRSWARDRRILLKDQCVLHNPAQVRLAQDDNLSTHLLRIGQINLSAKPVRSAMANFQGPISRANRRVHREESRRTTCGSSRRIRTSERKPPSFVGYSDPRPSVVATRVFAVVMREFAASSGSKCSTRCQSSTRIHDIREWRRIKASLLRRARR